MRGQLGAPKVSPAPHPSPQRKGAPRRLAQGSGEPVRTHYCASNPDLGVPHVPASFAVRELRAASRSAPPEWRRRPAEGAGARFPRCPLRPAVGRR